MKNEKTSPNIKLLPIEHPSREFIKILGTRLGILLLVALLNIFLFSLVVSIYTVMSGQWSSLLPRLLPMSKILEPIIILAFCSYLALNIADRLTRNIKNRPAVQFASVGISLTVGVVLYVLPLELFFATILVLFALMMVIIKMVIPR